MYCGSFCTFQPVEDLVKMATHSSHLWALAKLNYYRTTCSIYHTCYVSCELCSSTTTLFPSKEKEKKISIFEEQNFQLEIDGTYFRASKPISLISYFLA